MLRTDIKDLHYITPIENIGSIMTYGILSRNLMITRGLVFSDISEPGVQDRRRGKKIPGTNSELHDYVNCYFDAHNPMLSARRSENDRICVLRIKSELIDLPDVIITDKNAARDCWFKTVEEGLPLLIKDEIYLVYWNVADYWEKQRLMGIKCAEVLIPGEINPTNMLGAYVANQAGFDYFKSVSDLSVEIKSSLFFY